MRELWHLLTNRKHCADCFDRESYREDPKGGDLLLIRMKPREIVVEVRKGVDVQITPQNWQKGRKTNRTA